jgi:hypothetical protein
LTQRLAIASPEAAEPMRHPSNNDESHIPAVIRESFDQDNLMIIVPLSNLARGVSR